jgi:hypothetical protein
MMEDWMAEWDRVTETRTRGFISTLVEVTRSVEFWFGWAAGIATAILVVVGSLLIVHLIIDY